MQNRQHPRIPFSKPLRAASLLRIQKIGGIHLRHGCCHQGSNTVTGITAYASLFAGTSKEITFFIGYYSLPLKPDTSKTRALLKHVLSELHVSSKEGHLAQGITVRKRPISNALHARWNHNAPQIFLTQKYLLCQRPHRKELLGITSRISLFLPCILRLHALCNLLTRQFFRYLHVPRQALILHQLYSISSQLSILKASFRNYIFHVNQILSHKINKLQHAMEEVCLARIFLHQRRMLLQKLILPTFLRSHLQ